MNSLLDVIRQNLIAASTVVPADIATVLDSLTVDGPFPPAGGAFDATGSGASIPGALDSPLSGTVHCTLSQPAGGGGGFVVRVTGAVAGAGTPIAEVQAANRDDLATEPPRASMTPSGAPMTVAFAGDLVISGSPAHPTSVTPDAGARAVLSSRHLVLPGGFGLSLPSSEIALSNSGPALGAIELILPTALPIVGGLVLPVDLSAVAHGTDITVQVPRTPAGPDGPHVSGTVTFHLGTRASLSDLVPIAISAVLELPGGGSPFGATGPHVPETIRVRVTASRPPEDPAAVQVAVTAESDGIAGLAHIGESGDAAAIAAGVTTVLGTAMAARGGAQGIAALGLLYAAARGFGPAFASLGGMVLHGVTLQASTTDGKVPVTLDFEGAVQAKEWKVEPLLKIGMSRPMRVRWRSIRAVIDVAAASIEDAIQVDLQGARPDVVDPGGWVVDGPGNLFEVIGSRGGSGSSWFEVDLRFTVDLGPVRVSGATIRATFADGALTPDIGLRGLDASVELPGVLRGGGKVTVAEKLDVDLWAQIVPLRVNAFVAVALDGPQVKLSAGVDLPAPILLGPTGLGLFSLAATIATNSGIPLADPADPMKSLRRWRPWADDGLLPPPGDLTLGAAVVVGTAVDDGFTANALGVVGVTVPDFALRIGLDAGFVQQRHNLVPDRDQIQTDDNTPGLTVLGGLSANKNALDMGLEAHLSVPYLFKMDIPAAGHFDAASWWLHLGSDDGIGGVHTGRPPGPVKAVVFPGLGPLQVDAGWAFLMIRGNGIDKLAGTNQTLNGFAVAAGIGFRQVFGVKPVIWAEVSASLIAAIGTRPVTVWAQGHLDGAVGLGPFRIGVSATATMLLSEGHVDLHFKVCAVVDLFFTELKGCIEIGSDTTALTQAPPPDPWPLPTVTLADGIGRLLTDPNQPAAGHLVFENGDTPAGGWQSTPTVWPDTIPLLTFPIAPVVDTAAGVRNEVHAGLSGSGRFQHEWHLTRVALERITNAGATGVPLNTVSAWQIPSDVAPDAPSAVTSDQRQLALLTVQQGLSLVHQAPPADGSIPPNVAQGADKCHWHPNAEAAWTYGADARRLPQRRSWRVLPRENQIGFPTGWPNFSRAVGFDIVSPADDPGDLLAGLSETGWIDDGGVVAFAEAVDADGASFDGALRLWGRTSAVLEERHPDARHTVELREPVAEGYLLVDTGRENEDTPWGSATVFTATGSRPAPIEPVGAGLWRVHLAQHGQSSAVGAELNSRALRPLAILGLYALAAAMYDGASSSASDAAALAALPPDTLVDGSGRVVLDAASQYRITATLAYHDRVDAKTNSTATDERTVHWFFRTAGKDPKVNAAQSGVAGAVDNTPWGDTVVAAWKKNAEIVSYKTTSRRVDRFDPGFLSRYLDGYTPADHEPFHFTGDPVTATFRAPHIAQLATTMGRAIGLAARRTDRSNSPHIFLIPGLEAAILAAGVHGPGLSAADLLAKAAGLAGCQSLPDGAQLSGNLPLQPLTPYELSVGLPLTGQTFTLGDPELDGVTFTTSAYAGPTQLIEAFQLADSALALASTPTAHGDVPIGNGGDGAPGALAGLADGSIADDAELEQTLAALGLPPLRPVPAPRSTVLWALSAGRWGVAGLLLESSEPLNRPGRMGIHAAALDGTVFPVMRASRSGTRVLWLRHQPSAPAAPAALVVTADDRGTAFQRRVRVEPVPRFLQGPIKAVRA
ncbi:hypothetical protein EV580_0637 [Mycobacterium sp. BK086]|uniref:hypothetical protein n=1 Tax=Mycobacterium sp. BK086 TaxID=2512165 RepID=UPI0010EC4E01|nr:hypothetical protein [Mycobacterium sp. BK086]TDO17464.1 hypothetical protein EV580_0637 [Mycobacterium sp. BK086]